MKINSTTNNPLLQDFIFPPFGEIKPQHLREAVTALLQQNRQAIKELLQRHQEKPSAQLKCTEQQQRNQCVKRPQHAKRTQRAEYANNDGYTWENLIAPLEEIEDRSDKVWAVVEHLKMVTNTATIRQVYAALLPQVSRYATQLGQNKKLYEAVLSITASKKKFSALDAAQRKILHESVRDFRLAGVALPSAPKQRFAALQLKLSKLYDKYSNNVLDATYKWQYRASDVRKLAGLPQRVVDGAARLAAVTIAAGKNNKKNNKQGNKRSNNQQNKKSGNYLFSLDAPTYQAVLTFADARALRRKFYLAYVSRASKLAGQAACGGGRGLAQLKQYDNSKIMGKIMQCRAELAQILKFNNYAELSLATKMARRPQQVMSFLQQLARRARPKARAELAELAAFARQHCGIKKLAPWDIAYCSEKLRQHKYALNEEELRAYFPASHVLQGMFTIVGKLFGLRITESKKFDKWHDDVRLFAVYAKPKYARNEELRGYFYVDLYAREHKSNGAWMADACVRRRRADGGVQLPIAYLNCNFAVAAQQQALTATASRLAAAASARVMAKTVASTKVAASVTPVPALLAHHEVVTLFHEFGHCLQHILAKVDYADAASINSVPVDAVEFPSQFMEHWCWQAESLRLLSRHHRSGAPLPAALLVKLCQAKNFQSGMQMLRQLEFALFDFELHLQGRGRGRGCGRGVVTTSAALYKILKRVRRAVRIVPAVACDRMPNSFEHIFGHGYAAGYYSYKWAEMLAADAFAAFLERGDVFDAESGASFRRNILEVGSSIDPITAFKNFRGRSPQIDALLADHGLVQRREIEEGAVGVRS